MVAEKSNVMLVVLCRPGRIEGSHKMFSIRVYPRESASNSFHVLRSRLAPLHRANHSLNPLPRRADQGYLLRRGGVLGITNAIWAVAAISGPILAGLLDDHVSHSAPWILNIVLCAAVVAWTIRTRTRATAG